MGDQTLTAVAVVWDVITYSLVEVYKSFRGMYYPPPPTFRVGGSFHLEIVCLLSEIQL
jgi:hypothetical protein